MTINTREDLWSIVEDAQGNLSAVGNAGTYFILERGQSWQPVPGFPTVAATFYGVWNPDDNDACAVGAAGTMLLWNSGGSRWDALTTGTTEDLTGIWGDSSTDLFVSGAAGTILRWDGANVTPMVSGTTEDLAGIWASGPTDIFVVGAGGTILHYGG
jgi:photosystem II stability/assembly factor-like uncharacterized protein